MKKIILATIFVCASAGAMAQNLSLQLGQTGYYGSIDLGNLNAPPVIYQQPMIIQQMPQYVNAPPMYLRVPPGHAKKWRKHCGAYNACGRPVLFVQDSWYTNTYAPHYRKSHGGRGRDHDDRGHYAKPVKMDRYDDHGGGKGKKDKGDKGHGKGHGNGKH
jgi:hypothetical protein